MSRYDLAPSDWARVMSKVDGGGKSECWQWTAYRRPCGYGYVRFGGAVVHAHRAVYTLLVGPIPEGMQLDHVCHTRDSSCPGGESCQHRACVNPDHLEVVSASENMARSWPANKTHCVNGHEFTPENTARYGSGRRKCRKCKALHERARRARRRAVGGRGAA